MAALTILLQVFDVGNPCVDGRWGPTCIGHCDIEISMLERWDEALKFAVAT